MKKMNWYIYEDPDAGPVYINIDLITNIAVGNENTDTMVYSGAKWVYLHNKTIGQVIAEINMVLGEQK